MTMTMMTTMKMMMTMTMTMTLTTTMMMIKSSFTWQSAVRISKHKQVQEENSTKQLLEEQLYQKYPVANLIWTTDTLSMFVKTSFPSYTTFVLASRI